ncbi:MAG TPA: MBOAT family protein [Chthoniobacterales bacterium]|nr:MBOAT family protein [Chthoniobacterales bacterium]
MLFNSPEFVFAFLPAFLLLYFVSPGRSKNAILFFASLFFYFTTSGELTAVLALSVIFNYYLALSINKLSGRRRTLLLWIGVAINIAPLLYYKYSRFFLATLADIFSALGSKAALPEVNPILPIGISFFTFQAISYIADVYMARVKPARNLIDFGMYHSCFPQLIAGPIVRYEEIESQVHLRKIRLDDIYNGVCQFCFGLGKKVVFADNMGFIADRVFKVAPNALDTPEAWLGVAAYTLQIYFDFSGYSDMAIGLGRVLGFWYPENFDQPYRSHSVTEFWRRWHMTLSRWFKDYVYIPLGGNRGGTARTLFNLFAVFFLCGLWHGAAYTFVVWGLYHGGLLVAERLAKSWVKLAIPSWAGRIYTLLAIMVGWVFFRSEGLTAATAYLRAMFTFRDMKIATPLIVSTMTADKVTYFILAVSFCFIPYRSLTGFRASRYFFPPLAAMASLVVVVLAIIVMSVNGFNPFIYFRF